MAQLNVVVRTLIRIAFGTALPSGTHQDALQSYTRATELNPERLIHRQALSAKATWAQSQVSRLLSVGLNDYWLFKV